MPLEALAGAVGTPAYVYSTATLTRHYTLLRAAADAHPDALGEALIAFAVKANSNLSVLATLALGAMTAMVSALQPNTERMRAAAGSGFSTATDLADWLVRELNLPFRKAHHVTGAAVKRAEALGVDLSQLPLAELQSLEPGTTEAVYKVLTPEASCASRQSFGGTAPEQVRARIAEWKTRLA